MKNIYSLFIGILIIASTNLSVDAQTFSPTRGATGVTISPVITITFHNVTSNVDYNDNNSICIGKSWSSGDYIKMETSGRNGRDSRLTIVNDSIIRIDLSGSELDYNTEYFVSSWEHNVINIDGVDWDNLYDDTYYRFTTQAPPTPPSITNYNPVVGDSTVRLNDTLKLTLNENIKLDRGFFRIKNKRQVIYSCCSTLKITY